MKRISQHTENVSLRKRFCKNVVYLVGLPGVGKTTVANLISKKTGFIVLDHNITYKEVCKFLKKGTRTAHELNGRIHFAVLNSLINSTYRLGPYFNNQNKLVIDDLWSQTVV